VKQGKGEGGVQAGKKKTQHFEEKKPEKKNREKKT